MYQTENRLSCYICANDTFDDDGRVLIHIAQMPHCEVLKLDINFIEKYKLLQPEFFEITHKTLSTDFATIFRTGYNIDDFDSMYDDHGIEWCKNNPRSNINFQIKLILQKNLVAIGLLQNGNEKLEECVPGYKETQ